MKRLNAKIVITIASLMTSKGHGHPAVAPIATLLMACVTGLRLDLHLPNVRGAPSLLLSLLPCRGSVSSRRIF
jgi:hypothetical protein